MVIKWDKKEDEYLLELVEEGNSMNEVIRKLNAKFGNERTEGSIKAALSSKHGIETRYKNKEFSFFEVKETRKKPKNVNKEEKPKDTTQVTSVVEKDFYGQAIKIHMAGDKDTYSLETLGKLFGYPDRYQDKAYTLYKRHIDELEQYTLSIKLMEEGERVKNIRLTRKGVWLMSMFVRTEVCQKVREWLVEVASEIDKKGYYATSPEISQIVGNVIESLKRLDSFLHEVKDVKERLTAVENEVTKLQEERKPPPVSVEETPKRSAKEIPERTIEEEDMFSEIKRNLEDCVEFILEKHPDAKETQSYGFIYGYLFYNEFDLRKGELRCLENHKLKEALNYSRGLKFFVEHGRIDPVKGKYIKQEDIRSMIRGMFGF